MRAASVDRARRQSVRAPDRRRRRDGAQAVDAAGGVRGEDPHLESPPVFRARRPPAVASRSSSSRCSSAGASATSSPSRCAAARGAEQWVFYEGPPTANGPPGSHHVLARVFKDIYPRYKTMRGYRVERKGGWDCHGLPVEIAVEQQLGLTSKAEIEEFGIAEFNRRCRESVFEFLEEWDRADRADRLLGRPRRRLPHARRRLHRVGLVGARADPREGPALRGPPRRPLLPALRHGAVLARGLARATRTSRDRSAYVKLRAARTADGVARGLDDDAVDAARQPARRRSAPDVTYARVRARRRDADRRARRSSSGCSARAPRSLGTLRGSELVGRRYRGPDLRRWRPRAGRLPGPRRRLRDDRGRHRHRPHGAGVRRGRLPPRRRERPVRPDRPADALQPGARATAPTTTRVIGYEGRSVVDPRARRRPDRRAARARAAAARGAPRALLPALLALRHAADLLRQAVLVHRHLAAARPPARRQRDGHLVPAAHQARAASATGSPTTSTGRSRASATGARRCRSGAATARPPRLHRLVRRARAAHRAARSATRTAPTSTS